MGQLRSAFSSMAVMSSCPTYSAGLEDHTIGHLQKPTLMNTMRLTLETSHFMAFVWKPY
jgi:hypothetical protein